MARRRASRHAITSWSVNLEIYGKALLGIEPNISPLDLTRASHRLSYSSRYAPIRRAWGKIE